MALVPKRQVRGSFSHTELSNERRRADREGFDKNFRRYCDEGGIIVKFKDMKGPGNVYVTVVLSDVFAQHSD